MKELNLYYEPGYDYGLLNVLSGSAQKLVSDNPNIKFNHINSKQVRLGTKYNDGPASKFGPFFLIIENPGNRKFIVVSFWDQIEDFFFEGTYWDMENCVDILTSVGAKKRGHTHELETEVDYIPISYMPFTSVSEHKIEECHGVEKSCSEKPFFRGQLYDFRDYLQKDIRFSISDERLDVPNYILELASNYLNFSVNGAGEISHREIEVMGTGTALFRTEFSIKLHEKLIPNHHYISVDWKDISFVGDIQMGWKELANRIIDRFEEVKNDVEYLKYVGENGRSWYLNNGTHNNNIRIICQLVDISKLFV